MKRETRTVYTIQHPAGEIITLPSELTSREVEYFHLLIINNKLMQMYFDLSPTRISDIKLIRKELLPKLHHANAFVWDAYLQAEELYNLSFKNRD